MKMARPRIEIEITPEMIAACSLEYEEWEVSVDYNGGQTATDCQTQDLVRRILRAGFDKLCLESG